MQAIRSCEHLEDLQIAWASVLVGFIGHLAQDISSLQNLKRLGFDVPIDGETFQAIGKLPKLEALNMYQSFTNGELQGLSSSKTLKRLLLRGEFNQEAIDALGKCSSLEALDVTLYGVIDSLEPLKQLSQLQLQIIDKASVKSISCLSQPEAFPKLRTIELYLPKDLTAEDIGELATARSDLQVNLKFGENTTHEAVMKCLKAFPGVSSLGSFSAGITDEIFPLLISCTRLKELDIRVCPSITQQAVDAFRQARPDVQVYFGQGSDSDSDSDSDTDTDSSSSGTDSSSSSSSDSDTESVEAEGSEGA
jgi:hypothetical protein